MEDYSFKAAGYQDSLPTVQKGRDKAASLIGLATSFRELVGKAGAHIDTSLHALTQQSGLLAPRDQATPVVEDGDYRTDDEHENYARDSHVDRSSDDDQSENRDYVERADHNDDTGHEHADDYRDGETEQTAEDQTEANDDADGAPQAADENPDDGQGDDDTETAAKDSADSDTEATDQGAGDDAQTAAAGDGDSGETVSAGTDSAAGQKTTVAATVNPLEVAVLADGKAHGDDGVASDAGKLEAAEGLTTAVEAVAAAETAAANGLATAASAKSKGESDHAGKATGPQTADTNAQTGADAVQQVEKPVEVATNTGAAQQAQAAELAKALGAGERMQVKVGSEADAVVSKPAAALSVNSFLAGEGKGQAGGQQTATGQNSGSHSAPAVAVAGQGQATAQQAQVQQSAAQNVQGQTVVQATADAKGPGGVSATANAGGTAHGGGEGTSATGSTANGAAQQAQQTQQSGQSAQAQANNATKPFLPGQAVTNQVSVKITKALQAGNDRINIQLRPAEMGRVEVKIELAHDGRLTAVVAADRQETLDVLRRDSAELQRALEEAGMHLDSDDLAFNLRGQEGQGEGGPGSGSGGPNDGELAENDLDAEIAAEAAAHRDIISDSRIDVRA